MTSNCLADYTFIWIGLGMVIFTLGNLSSEQDVFPFINIPFFTYFSLCMICQILAETLYEAFEVLSHWKFSTHTRNVALQYWAYHSVLWYWEVTYDNLELQLIIRLHQQVCIDKDWKRKILGLHNISGVSNYNYPQMTKLALMFVKI